MAAEARDGAYAPYSGYKVGAALLLSDGTIYKGCNIENASYGLTVCAERNAIFRAVGDGRRDFTAIAIISGDDSQYCSPCGACRQVMNEFVKAADFKVIMGKTVNDYIEVTLEELLPYGFGPQNLN